MTGNAYSLHPHRGRTGIDPFSVWAKAFGVIADIVADRHGTIHTDSGDGEGRLVV